MKIGHLDIKQPLFLAPMEDVTDTPFRLICKRLGVDIVCTEFTSSEALIRHIQPALKKIEITPAERPVGIQLFGGVETSMEKAVRVVEEFQPDFIDINCGCWVKNHALRGEGAGLLRDLQRFEKIVRSVVQTSSLPVTVKTRLGWDENSIVIEEVAKMVEQAGAQALAVHCRTRAQGHRGEADWSWLEKIKKVVSIPLIGNGDVETPEDVKRMFETGCDGVMIGRTAITNPWIFRQAKHYLRSGEYLPEVTVEERVALCIEHLKLSLPYKGERSSILGLRKHYVGYFRGVPHVSTLRSDLMQLMDVEKIIDRLSRFLGENSKLVLT